MGAGGGRWRRRRRERGRKGGAEEGEAGVKGAEVGGGGREAAGRGERSPQCKRDLTPFITTPTFLGTKYLKFVWDNGSSINNKAARPCTLSNTAVSRGLLSR